MPTPEQGGSGRQERSPVSYHRAARFASERPAIHAYERLQNLLEQTPTADLSAYRLQLNRVPHVAVIGEPPPSAIDRRITRHLSRGQFTTLAHDILTALTARRAQETRRGPWVVGHHEPGVRIPVPPRGEASGREPIDPIPLPEELADFLRRQPSHACVSQATNRGTSYVIKASAEEIARMPAAVPIHIQHELYRHPAAPVVRTVITIHDDPEHPLRLESFLNVAEPDQRADLAALAEQEDVLLFFYDEQLRHRLSKRLPNAAQPRIPAILVQAEQLLAAIPPEHVDFDTAKAVVIARTHL